jgi:hypothetical protein
MIIEHSRKFSLAYLFCWLSMQKQLS